MKKDLKIQERKGITLVALVITIIILLILSGISIQAITNTGLFKNAKKAKELSNEKSAEEKIKLILSEWVIKNTTDGTTLIEFLSEKLEENQIEDFEYNEENETYEIIIDKQIITINKNGEILEIEKSGPRPIISEIKIVNINGEEIPEKSIEVGSQKIYIKFKVSIENGEIKQVKIQNKEVYLENEQYSYEVTENGNYTFEITGKVNDEIYSKNKTIVINKYDTLPAVPIITSSFGYPILNEYGIENKNIISIKFDENNETKNYYSFDEKNWQEYKGEINADGNQTIYAKSVKSGGLFSSVKKTITRPTDAIGYQAFDGDDSTYYRVDKSGTYDNCIGIDKTAWGKSIQIHVGFPRLNYVTFYFYDSNGNKLENSLSFPRKDGVTNETKKIEIPQNAVIMKANMYLNSMAGTRIDFYEIKLDTKPTIKIEEKYGIIKENEIEKPKNLIKLKYYSTNSIRKYKIGENEEWKDYNDEIIEMNIGEKLYAKGINVDGKESSILEYTANKKSDAIGYQAFDGDDSTYYRVDKSGTYDNCIGIDKTAWGKSIQIHVGFPRLNYVTFYFYDSNGNKLENSLSFPRKDGVTNETKKIEIPQNAVIMKANMYLNSMAGTRIDFYEMKITK